MASWTFLSTSAQIEKGYLSDTATLVTQTSFSTFCEKSLVT